VIFFDDPLQDVNEDWPLTIVDHNFNKKMVFLKPGVDVMKLFTAENYEFS
jgi:hypothetical protein